MANIHITYYHQRLALSIMISIISLLFFTLLHRRTTNGNMTDEITLTIIVIPPQYIVFFESRRMATWSSLFFEDSYRKICLYTFTYTNQITIYTYIYTYALKKTPVNLSNFIKFLRLQG